MAWKGRGWLLLSLFVTFCVAYWYPYLLVHFRAVNYDALHAKPGFGTLYGRSPSEEEIGFLITGDWGMKSRMQSQVAKQMEIHAKRIRAQFILSAGDNIYSWGAGSPRDPKFTQVFEIPFSLSSEFNKMPWYMSLGNHDRRGNIESQIKYSEENPRWVMPNRYYSFELPAFDHLGYPPIEIIVLDTLPLICSDINNQDTADAIIDVECEPFLYSELARELAAQNDGFTSMDIFTKIHEITSIERREQLLWLNETLSKSNPKALQIVIGHHAMESASLVHGTRPLLNFDLRPLLNRYGVDLYICGHDHNLQHVHHDFEHMHHVVAGGGGFVTVASSLHPVYRKSEYPGLQFAEATFGFATAVATKDSLSLEFVDYRGNIIYNATISDFTSVIQI